MCIRDSSRMGCSHGRLASLLPEVAYVDVRRPTPSWAKEGATLRIGRLAEVGATLRMGRLAMVDAMWRAKCFAKAGGLSWRESRMRLANGVRARIGSTSIGARRLDRPGGKAAPGSSIGMSLRDGRHPLRFHGRPVPVGDIPMVEPGAALPPGRSRRRASVAARLTHSRSSRCAHLGQAAYSKRGAHLGPRGCGTTHTNVGNHGQLRRQPPKQPPHP